MRGVLADGFRGAPTALLAALLSVGATTPAFAQDALETGLSRDRVAITSSFTGQELVLFGARQGEGDILVVVRGPPTTLVLRKRARIAGLWMNRESLTVENVPGYLAVAASAPLERIAAAGFLDANQIGADRIVFGTSTLSPARAAEFRAAVVRDRQQSGLYMDGVVPVAFIGPSLFRTAFRLPAAAPIGTYEATIHLLRDGQVAATDTRELFVSKTGLGRAVYDYAHQQKALYGLAAVLLALAGGWVAATALRRN